MAEGNCRRAGANKATCAANRCEESAGASLIALEALHLGSGPAFGRRTTMTMETASTKKPGAVSRPGAAREFQFQE
jgi:hypothetical protein